MYKINLREVLAFLLVVSVVFLSLFYKLQPPPPASFSWSWCRGRTIPTFSPTLPFLEDSPGRTSKFPLFSTEWQFHFHFSIDRTVSAQQWMKPVNIIASVKDTRLNVGRWWNLLKSILFMTRRCQLLEGRGTNQQEGQDQRGWCYWGSWVKNILLSTINENVPLQIAKYMKLLFWDPNK